MKKIINIILIVIILFSGTFLIESYANVNLNENIDLVKNESGKNWDESGTVNASSDRIIAMVIPMLNNFIVMPLIIIFFIIGLVKIYKYKEWKVMRRLVIISIIYFVIIFILQIVFDGWAVNIY